jgi:MFS family permease
VIDQHSRTRESPNRGGAAADGRAGRATQPRALALLALPTFGLAVAITAVSTYVPVVARHLVSSTAVIGLIVGAEGLAAVTLPIVVGTWSDQLRTRLGGRLPFLLAATPVGALALIGMGAAGSLGVLILAVVVFFAAYFIAYEPYRALYPDLVDDERAGRAQSAQAVARGAGTGVALVGGGILLTVGQIVPFAAAAIVLGACIATFSVVLLRRRGVPQQDRKPPQTASETAREIRRLLSEHPPLRAFLAANALWELTLAAIKTFVVLWLTVGLHRSLSAASAIIGVVALVILVAAGLSGKLADRHGRVRVMTIALWVYGLGLLIPVVTTNPALIAPAVPFIAIGGGVTMTLPYALLMPMMPSEEHGTLTGLYSVSRGIGIMLGPLLAGTVIQLGSSALSATHGYAGMWLVAAISILLSIPLLARMRARSESSPSD